MKNDVKKIEQAGIARRILATIMDGSLAIFIMLFLSSLVLSPIANKAFHYSDKTAKLYHYQIASKLRFVCTKDDNDNIDKIYDIKELNDTPEETQDMMLYNYETDDLEFYKCRIKYYYLNYKTGVDVEAPDGVDVNEYKDPNWNVEIDGKLPSEIYTESWFNEKFGSLTTKDDYRNAAYEATKDLCEMDYYVKENKDIKWIQVFIIVPSILVSFSLFFILFPLIFKNGETLGKKTVNIGLVTKDGYSVKKRQIVLRQISLLLYVCLSSFILGVGYTSIATLFLGVFIYFTATIISKTKRSPMDYLAYTYCIDTLKSVWFKDEFEEKEKIEQLEENMKKYHKGPVENKNIIQVGSEIVNEDIKKEIEEENKNK